MNIYKECSPKVESIFHQVQQYLKGKITIEEAKENITLEMSNIRPIQYEEFKYTLGNVIKNSKNDRSLNKLRKIFSTYIPFPFKELAQGHPLKNHYKENAYMRELIIEVDKLENEEVTLEQWLKVYECMKNYEIHINRQRNNLYSYLNSVEIEEESKKASKLGLKILEDIDANINYLKKKDGFNFLCGQKDFMNHVMLYLDLEERVLFPASVMILNDEDFINIKKEDDKIGYAFFNNVLDFVPENDKKKFEEKLKNNLQKSTNKSSEVEYLILQNMIRMMNQAVLLFNLKGDLISSMGNINEIKRLIDQDELNISEDLMLELTRGENKVIKIIKKGMKNESFEVIYSIAKDDYNLPKGVLMIINIM